MCYCRASASWSYLSQCCGSQSIFGMATYAESQLVLLWRHWKQPSLKQKQSLTHMFRSKCKRFSFHHQIPAELFSALQVCCTCLWLFPLRGNFVKVDLTGSWTMPEWGASQPPADVFQLNLILLEMKSQNSKAWEHNGITVYLELQWLWGWI